MGRGYKDLQRSQLANPFSVRKWTRVGALEKFPHHLRASAWSSQLPGLASKVLSCHGDADQSCRVDVAIRTCRRGKHRKRKREETALWRRSSGCCGALGQVMTPRGYVWEATSVVGRETHTGLRCPRDSNFLYFTNDLREVLSCETLFHRTAASPARRRRPPLLWVRRLGHRQAQVVVAALLSRPIFLTPPSRRMRVPRPPPLPAPERRVLVPRHSPRPWLAPLAVEGLGRRLAGGLSLRHALPAVDGPRRRAMGGVFRLRPSRLLCDVLLVSLAPAQSSVAAAVNPRLAARGFAASAGTTPRGPCGAMFDVFVAQAQVSTWPKSSSSSSSRAVTLTSGAPKWGRSACTCPACNSELLLLWSTHFGGGTSATLGGPKASSHLCGL